MKIGVVVFPGSNCDHDAYYALKHEIGVDTAFLFHKEHDLQGADAIVTGLSCNSSLATVPVTLRCLTEKMGVSETSARLAVRPSIKKRSPP